MEKVQAELFFPRCVAPVDHTSSRSNILGRGGLGMRVGAATCSRRAVSRDLACSLVAQPSEGSPFVPCNAN